VAAAALRSSARTGNAGRDAATLSSALLQEQGHPGLGAAGSGGERDDLTALPS